jgi:hypothetical protein
MSDTIITNLTELTAGNQATGDVLPIVDISDTSMAGSGTTKKIQIGSLKAAGSDITTGTDDVKFITSKSLADATLGKLGAAWTTWSPSWTNLTVGNGTTNATYIQIGKTVIARLTFTLGTTSSISGAVSVAVPVAANGDALGSCIMTDAGTQNYTGEYWAPYPFTHATNSTYSFISFITATAPFTWTTGDSIIINMVYEAA